MQCANSDFLVHWNNTTKTSLWRGLFHHHMTSTLTRLGETEALQYADDFPP
ncbi:MAG: hypothetical protein QY306_02225 [Anaerolineales bacterium]|nr:MAG: hypothetical protein QY306_02225 [Anaerolineales bacterium]